MEESIARRPAGARGAGEARDASAISSTIAPSQGESIFIEPQEVVELGNRLAEARADERREVERILIELSRELLEQRSVVDGAALRVGELEVALASARYAAAVGARPALQPRR